MCSAYRYVEVLNKTKLAISTIYLELLENKEKFYFILCFWVNDYNLLSGFNSMCYGKSYGFFKKN